MPRFYDDIFARKAFPLPELRGLLEKATVIVADNVAEYLYSGTDQDYWSLENDFPNLAPPFEIFFVEWREPKHVVTSKRGSEPIPSPRRNGALFVCSELSAIMPAEPSAGESWRWLEHIWLWSYDGNGIECLGFMTIKVGEDGRVIRFSDKSYFAATVNPALATQPPAELFLSSAMPALLTVCFLHCKNVRMEAQAPPPRLAKKYRLRYGRAPVVYKTLVIEPLKQVLSSEGNAEEVGLRKALHICRGHFKDYTQRGLFGKIHGVFWWSDHLAGTLRSGLVKKEYDMRIPKSEPPKLQ